MGNQQSRLERDHATVSEAEARFAERNRITSKQRKNWQGRPKVVQNSKQYRAEKHHVSDTDQDNKYFQTCPLKGYRIDLPSDQKIFRCVYCARQYATWSRHVEVCPWLLKNAAGIDQTLWFHCELCNEVDDYWKHSCCRESKPDELLQTLLKEGMENDHLIPTFLCGCGKDLHLSKNKGKDMFPRSRCSRCTALTRPKSKLKSLYQIKHKVYKSLGQKPPRGMKKRKRIEQ